MVEKPKSKGIQKHRYPYTPIKLWPPTASYRPAHLPSQLARRHSARPLKFAALIGDRTFEMPHQIALTIARDVNGIGDLNRRQVQIVSVISMLVFLSTLAVALRLISRRISTRCIRTDDYVIVFALVRESIFAPGCITLIPACSCFHTVIAFVNSLVSESAFAVNANEDDSRRTG